MNVILIFFCLLTGISSTLGNDNFYDYQDEFNVYFPSAFTLPKNNSEIEFYLDGFQTSSQFDESGSEVGFTGQESYSRFQGQLLFRRGFSERTEFRIMGRYRQNASKDDEGTAINVSGIESLGFGFKYRLIGNFKNMFSLDVELRSMLKDITTEATSADEIDLSEDGYDFKLGGIFSRRVGKRYFLNLSSWFRRPGRTISDNITYDFNVFYKKPRAAFGVGLEGIQSLSNDPAVDINDRITRFPGVTNTIFGFNPSYSLAYGQANFAIIPELRGSIKLGQVIRGESWDKYNFYALSLTYQKREFNPNKVFEEKFKEYDVEASVTKVSPRKVFVQIDKGLTDDIPKGAKIDVFEFNYLGGNKLIASGFVFEVGVDTAIIKITKYYNEKIRVKVGHIIRGKR